MFLLVNNRPIQSADSIGFWPIVSVSADSQNSTIGRPLQDIKKKNVSAASFKTFYFFKVFSLFVGSSSSDFFL